MKTVKITEELFTQLKNELRYSDPFTVAMRNATSEKTVLQIKGSKDYLEYRAHVKAQHPPVQLSMRDAVLEINRKLDYLLSAMKENKLL